MAIKLQNIHTNQYLEKSELNWQHLDAESKKKYRVVPDGEVVKPEPKYTPPELEEEKKSTEDVNGIPAVVEVSGKVETPEEKALRLAKAGGIKADIVKVTGLHHKTVESIINSLKK